MNSCCNCEEFSVGFLGKLISEQDQNTDTLAVRARSVAMLLYCVEDELRDELLAMFAPDDKLWLTRASENLCNLTDQERVQTIESYLEVKITKSLRPQKSLEKTLIARLEESFKADKEIAVAQLRKQLRPKGKVTIGEAIDKYQGRTVDEQKRIRSRRRARDSETF